MPDGFETSPNPLTEAIVFLADGARSMARTPNFHSSLGGPASENTVICAHPPNATKPTTANKRATLRAIFAGDPARLDATAHTRPIYALPNLHLELHAKRESRVPARAP